MLPRLDTFDVVTHARHRHNHFAAWIKLRVFGWSADQFAQPARRPPPADITRVGDEHIPVASRDFSDIDKAIVEHRNAEAVRREQRRLRFLFLFFVRFHVGIKFAAPGLPC